MMNSPFHCTVLIAAVALASCGGGGSPAPSPGQTPGPPGSSNRAPILSGQPLTEILVDEQYVFTPVATDPDGDGLVFTVENAPAWAAFDPQTGTLAGTPGAGDVGSYSGILITASDGRLSASIGVDINVVAMGLGAATVRWAPPTYLQDGSPFANLGGYRIYYGRLPGELPNRISIDNPGLTSYVVDNLARGTYTFVVTAVSSNGFESPYSQRGEKVIE